MRNFDLFGNPVPDGPGRPEHVVSAENVLKVRALLLAEQPFKAIADALGISLPTLKKHYFSKRPKWEKERDAAVEELSGLVTYSLVQQGLDGNVAALKELRRQVEQAQIDRRAREITGDTKPKERVLPKGKKELLAHEADEAMSADSDLDPYSLH